MFTVSKRTRNLILSCFSAALYSDGVVFFQNKAVTVGRGQAKARLHLAHVFPCDILLHGAQETVSGFVNIQSITVRRTDLLAYGVNRVYVAFSDRSVRMAEAGYHSTSVYLVTPDEVTLHSQTIHGLVLGDCAVTPDPHCNREPVPTEKATVTQWREHSYWHCVWHG